MSRFLLLALVALVGGASSTHAQSPPEPRREQLLNGISIVLLPQAGSSEVLLKMRVRGGAAFDLAGKEGTARVLAELLFPGGEAQRLVAEEFDGRLAVETDHDSIDVTITGRADAFERMFGLLQNAISNSENITTEEVAQARAAVLASLKEESPAEIANRTVARRLFSDYPLGRSATGTPESLARIDRADLLLARERLLNPNNTTLVIIGGVEASRALRAARQLLGAWRKSDAEMRATFRQPVAPPASVLIVNHPNTSEAEIRLAMRGLPRTDPDVALAGVLAQVARERIFTRLKEAGLSVNRDAVFVRHDADTLAGIFVAGARVETQSAAKAVDAARTALESLNTTPPTATELAQAQQAALTTLKINADRREALADFYLAREAKTPDANLQRLRIANATIEDLRRVATRLFRLPGIASVAVGDEAQLASAFRQSNLEMVTNEAAPPSEPNAQRRSTSRTTIGTSLQLPSAPPKPAQPKEPKQPAPREPIRLP